MRQRLMVRLGLLGVLTLLVAAPLAAQNAAGSGFNGAHWAKTGKVLALDLGNELSNGWDGYLKRASGQWSKARFVNTKVVVSPGGCRLERGRVEVCNGRYSRENWLGLTIADIDGNRHIYRAVVTMNDYYFDQARFDRADVKRHTMCHEIGHALGLDHRSGKSCLNQNQVFGNAYDAPDRSDYRNLTRLYKHRDREATTRAAGVEATAAEAPETVDADLIESAVAKVKARGGADNTVVEDLGGGRTRVIHVTFPEDVPATE